MTNEYKEYDTNDPLLVHTACLNVGVPSINMLYHCTVDGDCTNPMYKVVEQINGDASAPHSQRAYYTMLASKAIVARVVAIAADAKAVIFKQPIIKDGNTLRCEFAVE